MAATLTIAADVNNLAVIRQFIKDTAAGQQVSRETIDEMVQAVDEAATNIIVHGYQGAPGSIEVEVELKGGDLVVRLRDQAPLFDPTQVPPPNLTASIEERCAGGLGVHLARQCTDEMRYRVTPDGRNELSLKKKLS